MKTILIINRPTDNYIKGTGIAAVIFWLRKKLDKEFKIIECKKVWKIPTYHSVLSILFYDFINPVLMALKYRNNKLSHIFFLDVSQCALIKLVKKILKEVKVTTLVHAYPEESGLYLDYARKLTEIAIKNSDTIISTAQENKNILLEKFPDCNPNKIQVFPLGLTTQMEHKSKEQIYCKKNGSISLGYLGTSLKRKRINKIIDLAIYANENKLSLTLLTAGPIKKTFVSMLDEKKSDFIEYKHFGVISEEEKASFFNSLDAFIFPTEREGFGLPILESFYFKKPCIIFNSTRIPVILKSRCILLNEDLTNFRSIYKEVKENSMEATIDSNYNFSLKFNWQCYVDYFKN